ncbi:ATP-binding cassette domain-containing protein (plasmid) [Azospirillum oryzae]|uniref:ATP-binding cassette domain-containing protein n=1 Tax=Azospirillum oryzae TaxID=286727 RepID=A0A6N1AZC0_9PROT|nr:ABC transporter ATP-binding protein [Azospirillum oryzae]KAA0585271.1 ATP-binding cassette domain-containing protein [Azospirillum oryzae]QKS54434.1 ATP-binding cassette domain-containing protein [Azospirillum oryzae]GLR79913.1 ABC transporter ATP-binding protein [Azospirillum oryzae]
MTVPALDVEGLRHSYGGNRLALEDVGFRVMPGAFTCLLGPNGAGKSTLFALATGLLRPTAGRVHIHGHDIMQAPGDALAHLGVVFQQPTLDLDLTVVQNLRYFAALHGIGRREADRRIEAELTRLSLFERRAEKVRALNGGHRRRVEIARALLHRPTLLLLDEPTVGLDIPARRTLIRHVHALCAEDGIAVLWATHLIDEIDPTTDHVVVLHRGRVRANGPVAAVNEETGCATVAESFDRLTAARPIAEVETAA